MLRPFDFGNSVFDIQDNLPFQCWGLPVTLRFYFKKGSFTFSFGICAFLVTFPFLYHFSSFFSPPGIYISLGQREPPSEFSIPKAPSHCDGAPRFMIHDFCPIVLPRIVSPRFMDIVFILFHHIVVQ